MMLTTRLVARSSSSSNNNNNKTTRILLRRHLHQVNLKETVRVAAETLPLRVDLEWRGFHVVL
jgi:hypothetical protein